MRFIKKILIYYRLIQVSQFQFSSLLNLGLNFYKKTWIIIYYTHQDLSDINNFQTHFRSGNCKFKPIEEQLYLNNQKLLYLYLINPFQKINHDDRLLNFRNSMEK